MFQLSTPKKFLTIRTNDCILVFSNVACWKKSPENRQIFTINTINMATHRITIYIHADLERDSDSMWFHTTQSEYIPTAQTSPYHNNIHQLVSLHIMHILVVCDSELIPSTIGQTSVATLLPRYRVLLYNFTVCNLNKK